MKILATGDGLRIVFTPMELAKLGIEVHGTSNFTPREVLERLALLYTATFEHDITRTIEVLKFERQEASE